MSIYINKINKILFLVEYKWNINAKLYKWCIILYLANFLRNDFYFSKKVIQNWVIKASLYILKIIVVQMHAKLNFFDNVIVGSTFFLDFKEIEEKK